MTGLSLTDNKLSILSEYPDVLTVEDLCAIFKMCDKTVRKHLKEGQIKSFRIGRIYRIPKIHLINMLKNLSASEESASLTTFSI